MIIIAAAWMMILHGRASKNGGADLPDATWVAMPEKFIDIYESARWWLDSSLLLNSAHISEEIIYLRAHWLARA